LNFEIVQEELNRPGEADLSTLQVHRYDPTSGKAEEFPKFASQRSPYDRPCRFEDNAVPIDFPDRTTHASEVKGDERAPIASRKQGGRLFNREMENDAGTLYWTHTQMGDATSYYAISWKVQPEGAQTGPSSAPWLGDADVFRREKEMPLAGYSHLTIASGDLNGDGMFDLFGGAEKGNLFYFLNRGEPGRPRFFGCKIPSDELGPLDCGWYAAPFIYDWDEDGLPDLLCGTSHNIVQWWKNVGSRERPEYSYKGPLQSDGARLEVPQAPVEEDKWDIFKVDYYNQPWVGDWNGDGLPDLLTGGYTTGRIFYYRCTGRDENGIPELAYEGPLEAGGAPIDTGWAAAPTAYDFDGDGLLELISGSWDFQGPPNPDKYLLYYENVGTKKAPVLERRPFPKQGEFPRGVIARATVEDFNRDGLPDLIVGDCGGNIYLCENIGEKGEPNWDFENARTLEGTWSFAPTNLRSSEDSEDSVSGDGHITASGTRSGTSEVEFLSGRSLVALVGSPHSPHWKPRGVAKVNGEPVHHESPNYGDPYNWNLMADWDGDGKKDLLSGTFQGNIFYHRRTGDPDNLSFEEGVKLKLTNGEDLKVGPPVYANREEVPDFTELQGSRIKFAVADFDGDGIQDLAVSDTYQKIQIFLNGETGATDALSPGIEAIDMPSRGELTVLDWNEDGKPDLMCGPPVTDPGTVWLNASEPVKPKFGEAARPLGLPHLFWGPVFHETDWNGDGDQDFLIRSEFFLFWAEKSFIRNGYRAADLVGIQSTPQ
jgi:hypothetical protein